MAVPWTGLQQLLDPDFVVTWEDLAELIFRIKLGFHTVIWECTLGRKVAGAIYTGDWKPATQAADTPPLAKVVGQLLARAVNGMLVEDGWEQQLDSPDLALKQEVECGTRLQPRMLPVKVEAGRRLIHFEGYPFIVIGTYIHDTVRRVIGAERKRLVSWAKTGRIYPTGAQRTRADACRGASAGVLAGTWGRPCA